MGASAFVVEELASRIAGKLSGPEESRVTPVYNDETHDCDGLLVESPLERIMVFGRERVLTLSDVSRMRRIMASRKARRALLYVPRDLCIPNSIGLLATLSKIEVIRLSDPTVVN